MFMSFCHLKVKKMSAFASSQMRLKQTLPQSPYNNEKGEWSKH